MDKIAPVKLEIAAWLAGLAPDALLAAEVGVKQAHLATCWLGARPDLVLYLVDRWKPADPASSYAKIGDPAATADADTHLAWMGEALARLGQFERHRVVVIHGESIKAAAGLAFDEVKLDAVFLDADHSYAGRLADLQAWSPLVKPGGLVAGGLLRSSFGGWGARDALHDHLATLGRTPSQIINGPAATWAYFQE